MGAFKDLTGCVFGRLTVIERVPKGVYKKPHWKCQCVCGNVCIIAANSLRVAHTFSCGCLNTDTRKSKWRTHGKTYTATFLAWQSMIKRCRYDVEYIKRNIVVCARWEQSFLYFLEDMGEKIVGSTLDRINNDGNYEPGNCRWTDWKTQNRNTRHNRFLTFCGETKRMIEWAEELHIHPTTLAVRLYKGWSVEEAFTRPVRVRRKSVCV